MTTPLAKWVMFRYAKMWKHFGSKQFSHKEAQDYLHEPKDTTLSLVIQELKRAGWVEVALCNDDSRVRLYRLKDPVNALSDMK